MDLLTLYATLVLDDSEYKKGIEGATGATSGLEKGLKTGLGVVAKATAAGLAAAGTAAVAFGKSALDSYADYQQLTGGVETLFKDSAFIVNWYADHAYQSAGLSANQYMETVTSFSASLISSLEGDTTKAAAVANTAVVDMADNANKMGTSIESIQNAYQGFAKQNYTMLDNLKLGYGGTKEEMERLIADANRVKEANGEMADLSIESFADIVEAIHTVQTEMGITGTTAKEADQTVSGSIASMKAAWENLKVGIADENADIDTLMDNFLDSVGTVANNILPIVQRILTNIFDTLAEHGPEMLEKAVELFLKIATGALSAIPEIIAAIPDIIEAIKNGFVEAWPEIKQIGIDIVKGLWEGIQSMGGWIGEKVKGFFDGLFDGVKENEEIHSPSKKWAYIGKNDALGFGKGWEDGLDEVENQISSGMQLNVPDIDAPGVGALTEETREYTFNFVNEMDGEEFGRKIYKLFIRADKIRGESLVEVGT